MITSFFSRKKRSAGSEEGKETDRRDANSNDRDEDDGNNDEGGKRRRVATTPPVVSSSSSMSGASSSSPSPVSLPTVPSDSNLCDEVRELLSHLREGDVAAATWKEALRRHTSSPSFASLAKFVAKERANGTIYPPPEDTFSALNMCPLHKVKVVVVGQDPYHGPNQGHGLAFSVRKGVRIPPSLLNIYKELREDPNVDFPRGGNGSCNAPAGGPPLPNHGYLERWARQGVLLLNTVLTVRKSEANSHAKRGWERFTDEVIRALDRRDGGAGLVFLLWGNPAAKKAESIINKSRSSSSRRPHAVICTTHPSPLAARRGSNAFLGSRCFSRVNDALRERGIDPIDWNVNGSLPEEFKEATTVPAVVADNDDGSEMGARDREYDV